MARWDARKTFSIDPKVTPRFNCVGIAVSENRECLNPIGKPKRITAARLLDELSALPISGSGYNERRLKQMIEELLFEVLCCRHKDGGGHSQMERVKRDWWGKIEMEQAAIRNDGEQQPAQIIQRRREYRPFANVEPAAAEWALQPLEVNFMGIAGRIQVLEKRIARDGAERAELMVRAEERRRLYERIREEERRAREREMREAAMRQREEERRREDERMQREREMREAAMRQREEERRREAERMQRERQLEANRIREEIEELMKMDREFAFRLAREEEEEEEAQQRADRRALWRVENRWQAQILYPVAAPQLFWRRPAQREVRRRPLGDCYSCLELIRRNEDADWCRAECGQNICHGCLVEWRRNHVGRQLTCGFCRAVWKFEDA
ncbi:stress response protein NST1 [Botrytis cinerea]